MNNPSKTSPPLSFRGLYNWTRRIISYYNIRPKEKLGQNFIVKPKILFDVLDCILSYSCSRVLEIGSGLGTLTYYLHGICGNIVSVEIDPKLAEISYNVTRPVGGNIVFGDGIQILEAGEYHQIVSNSPYYLSAKIIASAAKSNSVKSISLLVQKEVGDRILASPSSREYGRLSVITQLFFKSKLAGVYPPSFFYPKPEVSGVLLCMKRIKNWDPSIHSSLEKLTSCLFSGRNKKATKQVEKCLQLNITSMRWLENRRVRELTPWEIERILLESRP